MKRTILFVLILAISLNISGQSSRDNGQISINNKDPSGGFRSNDGGAAVANGQIMIENTGEVILNDPAPQSKDRFDDRRQKRQQAAGKSFLILSSFFSK